MMDIVIPAVGESITEATISEWLKNDGDYVEQNDVLLSLDTDKASVEVVAEKAGVLKISTPADETVEIGAIVGSIDTSAQASPSSSSEKAEPIAESKSGTSNSGQKNSLASNSPFGGRTSTMASHLSPATRRVVEEKSLDANQINGTGPGGRITKDDAMKHKPQQNSSATPTKTAEQKTSVDFPQRSFASREPRREKMTTLRKKIAERLVQAQQTAAILTTFNEVDMTAVMNLRTQYKDQFEKKYGIRLGFMGFFAKAVIAGLKDFPKVNAFIDGDELILNDFVNMGIAVGGPKGLVVPVIKDADLMSIAEIENEIKNFATKVKNNKLTIDDLNGGTFTISNGGVYGSLMST